MCVKDAAMRWRRNGATMRQTDQQDTHAPLGAPIRPERDTGPEWVADDPARPHIQRNVKDGTMRNNAPEPTAGSLLDVLQTVHQIMRDLPSKPAPKRCALAEWDRAMEDAGWRPVVCKTDATATEWPAIHKRQADDMQAINAWIAARGTAP